MASQGADYHVQRDLEGPSTVQAVVVEISEAQQAIQEGSIVRAREKQGIIPRHSVQGSLPPTLKMASTPMAHGSSIRTTPPGAPGASYSSEGSYLLRALRRSSLEEVKAALAHEPDAAICPIMESFEPPLCCAVQLGCSEHIVQLLLQHGAMVDAENAEGRTPLMLLSMVPSFGFAMPHMAQDFAKMAPSLFEFAEDEGSRKQQWSLKVAKLLIDAGADPRSSEGCNLPSAVQLASQAGNSHLVRFYSGECDPDAPAADVDADLHNETIRSTWWPSTPPVWLVAEDPWWSSL